MKKANLHKAKTNLSKLVDLAKQTVEVIACKAGDSVAKIIPFSEDNSPRKPGELKGKIIIKKDFDILPEDFKENF